MEPILAAATTVLAAAAVLASYPTLKALYNSKDSSSLSLLSWVIWALYDVVSLLYSVTIKAYIYTAVNACWMIFYIAIIVMIIKYRRNKKLS